MQIAEMCLCIFCPEHTISFPCVLTTDMQSVSNLHLVNVMIYLKFIVIFRSSCFYLALAFVINVHVCVGVSVQFLLFLTDFNRNLEVSSFSGNPK